MASTNAAALSSNPDSFKKEVVLVSSHGSWAISHLSASATAQTGPELIRPFNLVSTNVVPIKMQRATRVLIRCRYSAAGVVTTSPVIRIIAGYGDIADGATTIPDDGTIRQIAIAIAQPLPCVPATDQRDATYSYSAPLSLTPSDLLGCNFFLTLVETAASITGAVDEVIEVMLLN